MQGSWLISSSTAKKVGDSRQDKAHNPASMVELCCIMIKTSLLGLVAHMGLIQQL